MNKQSLNLSTSFFSDGYVGVFIKIVIAIILIYGFIVIVNFFRDKFIKKENLSKDPQIIELIIILNKVFLLAGFGFVIANILEVWLNEATNSRYLIHEGDWDYLTFGVISIFIGIGFKGARKVITKDNQG